MLNQHDEFARWYNLLFEDWQRTIAAMGRGIAAILRELDVPTGSSVLDCTCGIGTQVLGLAAEGFHVVGSDLSLESIRRAKREAQQRGLPVRFELADARSLNIFEADSFDVVISFGSSLCLFDFTDVLRVIGAMARVVRPAGIILIESFDWSTISPDLECLQPRSSHQTPDGWHICFNYLLPHRDSTSVITYVLEDSDGKVTPHRFRFDYRHLSRIELEEAATDVGLSVIRRVTMPEVWGQSFIVVAEKQGGRKSMSNEASLPLEHSQIGTDSPQPSGRSLSLESRSGYSQGWA